MPRALRHWRARKRDIIFMLSPRVSMALLPALSSESERGKGKGKVTRQKESAKVSGGLRARLSANTAVSASLDRYSRRRRRHNTEDPFVTCLPNPVIVKPSNRIAKKTPGRFLHFHHLLISFFSFSFFFYSERNSARR